jgi:HK97 family phage major capsid protein
MDTIKTRDDALKVLSDLKAEQKRLQDSNRDLTENMEKKAAALKDVQQKLAELDAPKVVTVSEREATLRQFVSDDGSLDVAGMANDTADRGEWHAEFKRLIDDRNLAKLMTKSGNVASLDAKLNAHMSVAPDVIRRTFSDSAGVGAEWIPDLLLPQLVNKLYTPKAVEALFPTMQMPGKELRLPFLTLKVKPYRKSGSTYGTITAEDDTTSQVSMTAESLAARIQVDEDASMDSIVAGLEYARASLADAISTAVEDAIINGDTAGSHQDTITAWNPRSRWNASGLGGSDDHRSAFLGLRAQAADVSATRNAGSDSDHYNGILTTRALMAGAHGIGSNLAMICSPEYYLEHLLAIDEVATIDKLGPQAVVAQGQVAAIAGLRVVVSDYMTADLEATGLFTDGSGGKTGYLIVNTDAYMMGNYKPLTVDIQREIVNGVVDVVATRRCVFKGMEAGSKSVAYAFNI